MRAIILWATVVLGVLFTSLAAAESFTGRVVKVMDGDTVEVLVERTPVKVRLQGIDSPESHQAFGQKAKQYALELMAGKDVRVEVQGQDRYGRTLGEVFLSDGHSANQMLVGAGYAWWYRKYSQDRRLGTLEAEARAARRGLWVDPSPVPPWEWRKAKAAR